jgi:hypothetical protein
MFEDFDATHRGGSIVILVGYQGQDTASREPSGPLVLSSVSILVWVAWSEDGTSRVSEPVELTRRGRVLVSLGNGLPRQAGWEDGGGKQFSLAVSSSVLRFRGISLRCPRPRMASIFGNTPPRPWRAK